MVGDRVNLLGLPRAELEAFVAERLGARPFRARQLMKWIYRRRAADFSVMSDLAQEFRARLNDVAEIAVPQIITEQRSSDGTRKWMLRMDEVQGIETVYIPEPDRGTLCISSQVGCALDCAFLCDRAAGFQSQPERCGNRRPSLVGASRIDRGGRRGQGRRPCDHQHRVHGHGRTARQLPQRRSGDAHIHG